MVQFGINSVSLSLADNILAREIQVPIDTWDEAISDIMQ